MLNRVLRCQDQTDLKKYWFNYFELICSALNKLPSVKGHVFQGITSKIKDKYPKKKIITWWGITSCTQTPDDIVSSLLGEKSTLLNIKILSGKDISAYSCNSNETEIVLLPGTRLRVNDVSYNNNFNIDEIDLEEINDEILRSDILRLETKQHFTKDESF
ncbi:unnamed protein product, partial [Rotaria sp. Silwood2]